MMDEQRDTKGRVMAGNTLAVGRKNGQKRPSYRQVLYEQFTEEGFAQGLRVAIGTASDARKPLAQLRALELLCKLAGLLQPTDGQDPLDPSAESIEDKRQRLHARLAELATDQEARQTKDFQRASSTGEPSGAGVVPR